MIQASADRRPQTAGEGTHPAHRRCVAVTVLGLCILTLLAACTRREHRKPNVLLVTLDTFRADRVGKLTPTLQQLEQSAVRFDYAVSAVPLTLPAHATILSGELPLHHGVRINGAGAFPPARETLATRLSAAGWRTGAFIGAFVLDHRFGLARGFDVYDDAIVRDPNDDSTSALEAQRRGSDVVDAALRWIRGGDARPWLAWVHLYDAHAPYAPPAPYPQTYDGEIAYVDAQLARLLAAVDRTNTVIAIVGDHGEALGEHGEPTHGLLLYDATLRVPMAIAAPGVEPLRITGPVSTADLAPTLAELAGAPMQQKTDGRSLASDLEQSRQPERVDVYSETQYPESFGWSPLSALRTGSMKLLRGTGARLFDLARDPHERVNVAEEQRRAYNELQASLTAMLATATAPSTSAIDEETRAKLISLGYVAPAGTGGGSGRDPDEMMPLYAKFEEAMTRLNAGQTRQAMPLLTEIVAADPANRLFRSTLARALRTAGDTSHAVALYREAVALAPNDADTWYNLASTLQEAGELREARAAIAEALQREPNRPEAHNTLGVINASEGNLPAAATEFQRAMEIDPRNARAWNNLGNVQRGMGQLEEAARSFGKAAELSPAYPDPLNGLGVVLVQQGRAREAIAYFDAALQLAPSFYEARLNRAIAMQLGGDESGARRELQALLAVLPEGRQFDAQRQAAKALLLRNLAREDAE